MHSYDTRSQKKSSPGQRSGGGSQTAGDDQSMMGNQAMLAQMNAGPTFEDGSPIPTHQGREVTDEQDPAARDTNVSAGASGALIGRGDKVRITQGRTSRSKLLAEVADGTPCEVLQVTWSKMQVRVRVGDKMETGWTYKSMFSDQPGISTDEYDKGLHDAFPFAYFEGDHDPENPTGKDTAQGALGDCFFIASMAAMANASPATISDAITYNEKSHTYTVRFYEEQGYYGDMKPVYITIDSYLPVSGDRSDPAFAGDPGQALWPSIMEKAYAKWKGGYNVIGEGGTGHTAMAEISGVRSRSKSPRSMREEDVIPFFEGAMSDGLAIYAGVRDTLKSETQTPLSGSAEGPYTGKLTQTHRWNEAEHGTLTITDKNYAVGTARDTGRDGERKGAIMGRDVDEGEIEYKSSQVSLKYNEGREPAAATDLEARFEYHGMLNAEKIIIGNHAYAFERVVDGDKLQFYNPWGSYQPKPITAAEFLQYYDSLSTNSAPTGKTTE
jgi:hypothetical protein